MTSNQNFERQARLAARLAKMKAAFLAPLIFFACSSMAPADAILNCLNPNMFKMNKGNSMHQPYGAERANWYPQSQVPYQPNYYGHSSFGQNPMKPGYGYGASMMTGSPLGGGGYHFSDQLNLSPMAMSAPTNPYLSGTSNDGWSAPVVYNPSPIQQTQLSHYDSYTQQPLKQHLAPLLDSYSTKGSVGGNKYFGTTKSNIMQATGYNLYDEPVLNLNKTYGYAYPDWYSGVESPSRIAQQLMKYGLKRQQQQHQNRSAPLIQDPSPPGSTSSSQFTILDEPRFVGYGTVDSLNNKEARLSCSFNEAIGQSNRPLWVKFLGPYNSSKVIDSKFVPPFNCANSQCRTQEIESTKDYRYKFDNGPATSTLIIAEPRLSDYGTYRCSALTKAINNNPIETIYQIVQLGDI